MRSRSPHRTPIRGQARVTLRNARNAINGHLGFSEILPAGQNPRQGSLTLGANPGTLPSNQLDKLKKACESHLIEGQATDTDQEALPIQTVNPVDLFVQILEDKELNDHPYMHEFPNINSHKINIPDHSPFRHLDDGEKDDFPEIKNAIDLIHDTREKGKNVYVHCHSGIGRSYCVVLSYLIIKQGMSAEEAHNYIRNRRGQVAPNPKQSLRVREFVFWHQKENFHPLATKNELIKAFSDFYAQSRVEFDRLLRGGSFDDLEFFLKSLKALVEDAIFILENLTNDDDFSDVDAKDFHVKLLDTFKMLTGWSALHYQILEERHSTQINTLQTLTKKLSEAIDLNQTIKKAEACSVCEASLKAVKKANAKFQDYITDHNGIESKSVKTVKDWKIKLDAAEIALNQLLESPDITITLDAVQKIQNKILEAVSLEPNIILVSGNKDLAALKTIHEQNPDKPILIKNNEGQISVYGDLSGNEWSITTLNNTVFTDLDFPAEPTEKSSIGISLEMKEEIKKGHNPKYSGNPFVRLCHEIKEILKYIFDIGRDKRNRGQECMALIQNANSVSISAHCKNIYSFFKPLNNQNEEAHPAPGEAPEIGRPSN